VTAAVVSDPTVTRLGATGARVVDAVVPDPDRFTVEALADVAARIPEEHVEHHLGVTGPLLPDGRVRRLPMTPAEVVRTVADNDCWVMLRRLVTLPEYEAVVAPMSAPLQLAARAAGEQPTGHDLIGFIGAPRAGVPLHFDRNHHLLVQLRGTKIVGIGHYDDPEVRLHQLERGTRAHRLNADRPPDREQRFMLTAGQALVLPAFTFHWVEGGDDVSIAAACVLATAETERVGAHLQALTRS
jgi:hypothetical protein